MLTSCQGIPKGREVRREEKQEEKRSKMRREVGREEKTGAEDE